MPGPDDWTDADFVPRDREAPGPADAADLAYREQLEWLRQEIRSRLDAGATQPEVVGWLVAQGCNPGAAPRLVVWAQTAPPDHLLPNEPTGGRVICVEMHYESGTVTTDPVASARARAAARRRARAHNQTEAPPGAEEFEFALPSDSAQSRLAHQATTGRAWVWWAVGAVIAVAVAVALATVLMS